ncbi:hypothetical protein SAMN05518865_10930 [Duganella sp. CF458]|uniref:hypothetical protein n=1 Tax=Duganella sp. CF458 TaxID=1884368 RepID=UPI0008EE8FF8|nr:hypothetical protein [Duganella sp. CF458]SFG16789.1 hypothetical protein SAMN05518865_10930 [Duganella sp. CF458]
MLARLWQRDPRHEGVMRINLYLLRLLYALMFFMLGQTTWTEILTHQGQWEPNQAVAWTVWTAFATLAGLGLLRPVKMLPIILLEVFYKVMWLAIVAYPLWARGELVGSPAESTTYAFLGVLLAIVAVPWGYIAKSYFTWPSPTQAA